MFTVSSIVTIPARSAIAIDWGNQVATAYRTVKRIEDILSKSREFHLPGKRQLQQSVSEIEVIIVDVAETEIERKKKIETLL